MINSAYSTAQQSLHSAQNQALQAVSKISKNPDSIPESVVELNQAKLQTQLAATTIRSLDETTGYLLDMFA